MKNHWLRKNEEKTKVLGGWTGEKSSGFDPLTVATFDKALSPEEVKELSTIEIVGDNIVFEGDTILLKGNVTIVGDLIVDGNLTITDCMAVNTEQEVNVIDFTFSSPPVAIIPPEVIKMMDEACGIGELT